MWPNPPQFLDTIADGIRLQQLGHVTWPIILQLVEKDVFTVVCLFLYNLKKSFSLKSRMHVSGKYGYYIGKIFNQDFKIWSKMHFLLFFFFFCSKMRECLCILGLLHEPCREKTCLCHMRTKAQISLRICTV